MSVDDRVNTRRRRKGKSWFIMLLQNTRQYHTRRRRVGREVPSHSIIVLENDTVCCFRVVIRIDTLVLDECHVEGTIDVQTVLLWKKDVLRYKIRAKHCWTRRNEQGYKTVLFTVKLTIATVSIHGSRKVWRWRRCGCAWWGWGWRECRRGSW